MLLTLLKFIYLIDNCRDRIVVVLEYHSFIIDCLLNSSAICLYLPINLLPNSLVLKICRLELVRSCIFSSIPQSRRKSKYSLICLEFKLHLYITWVFRAPPSHMESMNSIISSHPLLLHPVTFSGNYYLNYITTSGF